MVAREERGLRKKPQCMSTGLTVSKNHSHGVSEVSRTEIVQLFPPRKREVRYSSHKKKAH